jgi:hypothetical protein
MKNLETTIVAFRIGRGGQFWNPGHLSFIGEKRIGEFTDELFCHFENESNFKKRFGFDTTHHADQKCILDLITDREFDELEEKFGISEIDLGEEIYIDCGGNDVGLSVADVKKGIGCINVDGQYNTIYTCFLEDCNENEIFAIRNSDYWQKDDLLKTFETE